MFKPLLRTLPSLSGNFTIGCKLNEIKKINNNEYYTYVRVADLLPLQNILYNSNIEINLLNGRYEYDVKKYYYVYSNYFYKDNYQYDKFNYKTLNLDSAFNEDNDSRNKNYEFGCKRISYSKNKYQFSFYAPIYIDNVNDLPEYFLIQLCFNDHYKKTIKIYINKKNNRNYLGRYLKEYLANIDDQVIFLLPDSAQATYFGIDVKNGGLTKYKDNIIGNIFNKQTTINNFDNTICKGFERNHMIMRQIIPLSFMFNINDLLNDYEKNFFDGYRINVKGYYCSKNNIYYDFYDFSIDYNNLYSKYKKYNKYSGVYQLSYGKNNNNDLINIMNVGYPSLNEGKYVKYLYTNKLTPRYCRFKMLLSNDSDPYITNLNFAYSYLQNPTQKYGYFPTMFKGIYPKAIVNNNDLKLPIGNNIDTYYAITTKFADHIYTDTTNLDKYIKLMSNYYSSWFNVYDINSDDDIKNVIKNESNWTDVNHNYAYFKGILYNLNDVSKYDIDKFGVFVSYNFNYYTKTELNESIVNAKYIFSKSDASDFKINEYNDSYDMSTSFIFNEYIINSYNKLINSNSSSNKNRYLLYDKIMKRDMTGNYIKEDNYYLENMYFKYNDVINVINRIFSAYNYNDIAKIYEELNSHKITGYLLLDAFNNENFFESYKIEEDGEIKTRYRFILTENLFKTKGKISNQFTWLYDRLYCTNEHSTVKHLLADVYDKINYNKDVYGRINVFLKEDYIYYSDILEALSNVNQIYKLENNNITFNIHDINNSILELEKYIYEYVGAPNGIQIENYFVKYDNFYSMPIYVDSMNLNNLVNTYNQNTAKNEKHISIENSIKKSSYIKFLNKDHIKEYYFKTNKDVNGDHQAFILLGNILNHIYVKKRNWIILNDTIDIKDKYEPLYNYIMNYKISLSDSEEITLSNLISSQELYDAYIQDAVPTQLYYWITFALSFDNALSDNDASINWLYENLSDSTSSNGNLQIIVGSEIIEFDLYFYKEVYKLDYSLFKLMCKDNQLKNYLYLYIPNNQKDSNTDMWDIIIDNNILFTERTKYLNINECLTPLFTSIYVNEYDVANINSMIQNNKIQNYSYVINTGKYFKEIDVIETLKNICNNSKTNKVRTYLDDIFNNNNIYNEEANKIKIAWSTYLSINNIKYENLSDEEEKILYNKKIDFLYSQNYIDKIYNIADEILQLYSIQNTLEVNVYKDLENIDNILYDNASNMYIYNGDGVKYGFYIINFIIDNTSNSFNIKDYYNINIQFDTINGYDLTDKNNKKYFNSIFYLLSPFLKINILNEFIKKTNCIVFPRESEISIIYSNKQLNKENTRNYSILKDSDDDILYGSLTALSYPKNIKLLRYFNYITPILQKTSVIENYWEHKFIEKDNITFNLQKNNIFNKSNINIYQYHPLKVYYGKYSKMFSKTLVYNNNFNNLIDLIAANDIELVNQIEYKHFNDNVIYNLPEFIEYNDSHEYLETEITEKTKSDEINNIKKQILSNYFKKNNLNYDGILLFLFNKYDTSFYIDKIHLKTNNSNDIRYKISYKFNLI